MPAARQPSKSQREALGLWAVLIALASGVVVALMGIQGSGELGFLVGLVVTAVGILWISRSLPGEGVRALLIGYTIGASLLIWPLAVLVVAALSPNG
jgi:hypothetical protein